MIGVATVYYVWSQWNAMRSAKLPKKTTEPRRKAQPKQAKRAQYEMAEEDDDQIDTSSGASFGRGQKDVMEGFGKEMTSELE